MRHHSDSILWQHYQIPVTDTNTWPQCKKYETFKSATCVTSRISNADTWCHMWQHSSCPSCGTSHIATEWGHRREGSSYQTPSTDTLSSSSPKLTFPLHSWFKRRIVRYGLDKTCLTENREPLEILHWIKLWFALPLDQNSSVWENQISPHIYI